jgi:hypothetical protein
MVFNLLKFSHVTPLLCTCHWLPVEACIHFKTMVLAYGAARVTELPYCERTKYLEVALQRKGGINDSGAGFISSTKFSIEVFFPFSNTSTE